MMFGNVGLEVPLYIGSDQYKRQQTTDCCAVVYVNSLNYFQVTYFPKMVPASFCEGTGFVNFLFNKLSIHIQCSQCFVLIVGTLIMLPWKCGAILSLVSGIELRFI